MEVNKKEKFYLELQMLRDKLEIIESLPDSVLNEYEYNFNKIINKLALLDKSIANGKVYRLSGKGSLNVDGYEKAYLFLFKGSSIKNHVHKNEKEHYKQITNEGEKHIGFCDINESHSIPEVLENTLVKTYKYIPESFR